MISRWKEEDVFVSRCVDIYRFGESDKLGNFTCKMRGFYFILGERINSFFEYLLGIRSIILFNF